MKIIVTGGNGFIGSYLIDALHKLGHDVFSYDICLARYNGVKTVLGNVLEKEKLSKAISSCDLVFHLAGMLGTHELVDCAIEATQV